MSLPTVSLIEAAVTNIFTALNDARDREPQAYQALQSLWEQVVPTLKRIYRDVVEVTITDEADASVAAAIAATGQLGLRWKALHPTNLTFPVGYLFSPAGATNDFTSNALATAKGGAVAAADIYQVDSGTTVKYLGAAAPDFSAAEPADF